MQREGIVSRRIRPLQRRRGKGTGEGMVVANVIVVSPKKETGHLQLSCTLGTCHTKHYPTSSMITSRGCTERKVCWSVIFLLNVILAIPEDSDL